MATKSKLDIEKPDLVGRVKGIYVYHNRGTKHSMSLVSKTNGVVILTEREAAYLAGKLLDFATNRSKNGTSKDTTSEKVSTT